MVALNNPIFARTMSLKSQIFDIKSKKMFENVAFSVFKYQFEHNKVYRSFCDLLYKHPSDISRIEDIPFLPIQFFKSHSVVSQRLSPDVVFSSSGTTGQTTSKHEVTDVSIYEMSYRRAFDYFYGNIEEYTILALLPSYLERQGSSLIYMVDDLITRSKKKTSGFYLDNVDELASELRRLDAQGERVLLIGVSFALLDFVEKYSFNLNNTIIMETGGMKGRRKELIRADLHAILCNGFGTNLIHSEYGMTELLSQAYSKGNGVFECPPWMKVFSRDPEDPLHLFPDKKTGGVNIIDLANLNSCSFIATQDLGRTFEDGTFEILGRFDHSDIRGCNLLLG